jgi:hypothetical protein
MESEGICFFFDSNSIKKFFSKIMLRDARTKKESFGNYASKACA